MALLLDFWIKEGDTGRPIVVSLRNADETLIAEDITDATVEFHMEGVGQTLIGSGFVVDPATKRVGYAWQPMDTVGQVGDHPFEFEVTLQDGTTVMTFPNDGNGTVHIEPQIA